MEWFRDYWPVFVAVAGFCTALVTSFHALLFRRDTRTTIAWMGLIWLAPLAGSAAYVLLGVNRITRRGNRLRQALEQQKLKIERRTPNPAQAEQSSPPASFRPLIRLVEKVTDLPLLPGNRLTPLLNGDTAYPEMLEAIRSAKRSISLATYIFDNDRAGMQFIEALGEAVQRGVDVRVLIDDVGSRYKRPTARSRLTAAGIRNANFLPTRAFFSVSYANLRNHRKIMVVDGRVGFTGGMNIREGCLLEQPSSHPVQDLHFRVEGPVVAHLQESFAADWQFTTEEALSGDLWFPMLEPVGDMWARGVPDGPDEDLDQLPLTLQGAIAMAQHSIAVCTPYFLPDEAIMAALNVAALRGVDVRILTPQVNNIRMVQWAAGAQMPFVLERGCRVYASPPPFDHSKIMLVDDDWSLIGSSNWDPRSLRLNFEFNVECYSRSFNRKLAELFDQKVGQSREVTLESLREMPLWRRLRDRAASLFTPYL